MHWLSPLSQEMHVLVRLLRLALSPHRGAGLLLPQPYVGDGGAVQEAGEEAAARTQSSDGGPSSGPLISSP